MTFEELYKLLESKIDSDPSLSNSAKYLNLGTHEIGKKVIEEAAESWMAAEHESPKATAVEISQLLYWTALLAISAQVQLKDILKEL
jgi:phosphoribosyl-ATP pyrophosphohydrolase